MRPLPTSLSLLFATAMAAQETLVARPEGAVLVAECAGPAAWAERFAGTKILELVRSKEFTELVAPLQKQVDAVIAEAQRESPVDVAALQAAVLGYGGRLRLVVLGDLVDGEPGFAGYLAASGDGSTDLAAACKELERLVIEEAPTKPAPRTLAGLDWLCHPSDEVLVTLPRMVGSEAAMVFCSAGREAEVEQLITRTPAPPAEGIAPPLHLRVDGKRLLDLVLAPNLGVFPEPDQAARFGEFMRAMFGTVGALELKLGTERQFVDFTAELGLPGPRGALFAVIAPISDRTPALLDCVPRQHQSFAVGALDLSLIEAMVRQGLEIVPEGELDWPGIEAAVEEKAGVRLAQDVLAHLGTGYVSLATPGSETLDAAILDIGVCVGLGLKDGAALARSFETILDRTGVLRMRKTEKYRDVDVHRLTLPVVAEKVYWAFTDELGLIAIGDGGLKNLQALLDGAAAVARGEQPGAFPRQVTERLAVVAPRYSGLSFQTMSDTLDAIKALLTFAQEQAAAGDEDAPPFDVETVVEVLDGFADLLRAHDLEHMLTVTYSERDRIVQRVIW